MDNARVIKANFELLKSILYKLPERHRLVIELKYFEKKSDAEIAEAIGFPSAAMVAIYRHVAVKKAAQLLKEKIEKRDIVPKERQNQDHHHYFRAPTVSKNLDSFNLKGDVWFADFPFSKIEFAYNKVLDIDIEEAMRSCQAVLVKRRFLIIGSNTQIEVVIIIPDRFIEAFENMLAAFRVKILRISKSKNPIIRNDSGCNLELIMKIDKSCHIKNGLIFRLPPREFVLYSLFLKFEKGILVRDLLEGKHSDTAKSLWNSLGNYGSDWDDFKNTLEVPEYVSDLISRTNRGIRVVLGETDTFDCLKIKRPYSPIKYVPIAENPNLITWEF